MKVGEFFYNDPGSCIPCQSLSMTGAVIEVATIPIWTALNALAMSWILLSYFDTQMSLFGALKPENQAHI